MGIFLLVESGIHIASHADVLRGCHAFLRDEPLRASAWQARILNVKSRIQDCRGLPFYGGEKMNSLAGRSSEDLLTTGYMPRRVDY